VKSAVQKPLYLDEYPSFGDFDRAALVMILDELKTESPTIVEIGSWLGTGSTQILLDHVKRHGGRLYCVDTWQGSPAVQGHVDMLATYDVYQSFVENVRRAGGEACVEPYLMSSTDAASQFSDASVDLVFVDGDHKYDAVRSDIKMWLPKIKVGGIICGHDCETRVTADNRNALMQACNADHMDGRATFPVWHAGVIMAVDEAFYGRARLWAEQGVTLPDGRHGAATLWDLRVFASGYPPCP
jgi:predicted O-methyltransferase YrrM